MFILFYTIGMPITSGKGHCAPVLSRGGEVELVTIGLSDSDDLVATIFNFQSNAWRVANLPATFPVSCFSSAMVDQR